MFSDERTPDTGTSSSDVVNGGAFSTAADFPFPLVDLGFGTGLGTIVLEAIVVDPILVRRDSPFVPASPIVTISTVLSGND
jgi:hypothetical protein